MLKLKRLTLLWAVLRGDVRQLWFALRHPSAPDWLKLGSVMRTQDTPIAGAPGTLSFVPDLGMR